MDRGCAHTVGTATRPRRPCRCRTGRSSLDTRAAFQPIKRLTVEGDAVFMRAQLRVENELATRADQRLHELGRVAFVVFAFSLPEELDPADIAPIRVLVRHPDVPLVQEQTPQLDQALILETEEHRT